ncbi:zinc finger, CCHC-type containing protein [Tanacetum coccineum]
MTDSRPVLEQYNELLGILGRFTQHKMNNDKAIKEELTLVELGSHLRIKESLRMQDSDKPKGNNVVGPSVVNMCGKPGHLKKDCKGGKVGNKANVIYVSEAYFVHDDVAWWVESGATVHVCKDRCWFKTYESLNDGSILHMGNESTTLVHGRGCVDLKFSSEKSVLLFNVLHVPNIRKNLVSSSVLNNWGYKQVMESNKFVLSKHGVFIGFGYLSNQMFMLNIVNDNITSAFMSTSKLNDSILWHARLGHVHFKRMQDMSKDGLILAFNMDTKKYKFNVFKTEVELQQGSQIKRFRTDRGGEYMNTLYFQSVGIIHETTAPYTPQQNGIFERKDRVLKEMVNSMLSYSGLNMLSILRLYVIEPNHSVSINFIIESMDAIFDENRFSSVPRPSLRIPNETKYIGGSVVPEEATK